MSKALEKSNIAMPIWMFWSKDLPVPWRVVCISYSCKVGAAFLPAAVNLVLPIAVKLVSTTDVQLVLPTAVKLVLPTALS